MDSVLQVPVRWRPFDRSNKCASHRLEGSTISEARQAQAVSALRDGRPGRRVVYTVVLFAALLGLFWFASRIEASGQPALGWVDLLVLGFAVYAVAGVLPLNPRSWRYSLGLGCLLLAFVAMWLASPSGQLWLEAIGPSPSLGLPLPLPAYLLFPVAWLLLASSVTRWYWAVVSYLAAGGLLVFVYSVLFGEQIEGALESHLLFWFGWPFYALDILGAFGRSLPS